MPSVDSHRRNRSGQGRRLHSAGQSKAAAAVVVGFDLIARTGELPNLTVGDVLRARTTDTALVRFRETKAGIREGVHQSVVVDEPVVLACFNLFMRGAEAVRASFSTPRRSLPKAHQPCFSVLGATAARPQALQDAVRWRYISVT